MRAGRPPRRWRAGLHPTPNRVRLAPRLFRLHAFVRRRRSAVDPARDLRLRAVPRPAAGDRRPRRGRRRRPGADAHRRRQVAVLPDPRHRAPARRPRRERGRVAADRADARPGRRPARGRRRCRLPQFHARLGADPGRRAPHAARRDHPAVRGARAGQHAALPVAARFAQGARQAGAVRHRRGPLREPVGPRLPPRIPRAHGAARALCRRAADRAHRHRRCADAGRHRRAPAARGGAPVRLQLRPAEHPLHHRREEGSHHAAAALHRARARGRRRRGLLPVAQAGRGRWRRRCATPASTPCPTTPASTPRCARSTRTASCATKAS